VKPYLITYNGKTCLYISNGEVFRRRPPVSQDKAQKYRNQESQILFAGFIPDIGTAPQVEFYMGLVAGDQYGPFSDNCELFIGIYKNSSDWQYNTVQTGYYSFNSGPGNNWRAVRKIGSTITDSGVNPSYTHHLAHMGAPSNANLAIIGLYYYALGTVSNYLILKGLIGNYPSSYVYNDYFYQRNTLLTSSAGFAAYGLLYPSGTSGSFTMSDADARKLTHVYFGWRTVAGTETPFYLWLHGHTLARVMR